MAKKIKVNIAGAAFTGKIVTFKAPCDCTEATGLVIGEDTYDVVDALGNCITGSYLAWRSGALVSVALDVEDKTATLQSSFVETDPTVPAWAKAASKPTYTASEVGAAPSSHTQAASTVTAGTFAGQVVANSSGQAYSTSLLRNCKLVSADTNPTVNGEICWTYK